ncbi:MAG: Hsp20 family protein [Xanthobacteraceae bacterium]|nr:Hsp20 family protein [Xanthobacteraceae bacterium]QYK45059.1 MAG: Hsp20 family protein [Xanthobacteraceae bacterium]
MPRIPTLSSPFLLGFEEIERALDRVTKGADGYPPYNIERIRDADGAPEKLRITLAVAGFSRGDLEITVEEKELTIRGRQPEDAQPREFLHRGIAARQFHRTFVLADSIEVVGANLTDGLLSVDLKRPEAARQVRRVEIANGGTK